jgi:hypothetical protein
MPAGCQSIKETFHPMSMLKELAAQIVMALIAKTERSDFLKDKSKSSLQKRGGRNTLAKYLKPMIPEA